MGGQAIKAWAKEHEPQPPLPIGTRIKQGVIMRIYDYDPATGSKKMAVPMIAGASTLAAEDGW